MTLKKKVRTKFVKYFSKRFRDDKTTLMMYARDMSDLPSPVKLLFKTIPNGVILPQSTEEIQKIFKLAKENNISIVPRGNGTAGFGGAVVYNKGIVVDCKGIESEIFLDPFEQSVIVPPSILFNDLQKKLKLDGFSLCVHPSSIYSATVGGWISHGGYGVGSVKYGGATDQILELEVVQPNGEIKTTNSKEDISLFVGSNGTLGIITKVKLRIKFDIPLYHRGCTYDNPEQLLNGLNELTKTDAVSIWFFNPQHVKEINETFGFSLPERYVVIISKEISYEEERDEFNKKFIDVIRTSGGQILDKRYIQNIWDIRFKTFALLKKYQDYIISEAILPTKQSSKFLRKLIAKFKNRMQFEGEMISPDKYSIIITIPFEENISSIQKTMINLRLFKQVLKSIKIGGSPYSTGLWFAGYYQSIFGKEQYSKYREMKQKIDPKNISNPGKVLSPRVKLLPILTLKYLIKLVSSVL
ncbi:MAG: FAD-binding oxidoreductase [Candidatus Heimdallarchaeaceae archaeon]